MAYVDFAPSARPVAAAFAPIRHAVRVTAEALNRYRAERGRRLAMLSLLEMEPYRLNDLGITPADVREALEQRRSR